MAFILLPPKLHGIKNAWKSYYKLSNSLPQIIKLITIWNKKTEKIMSRINLPIQMVESIIEKVRECVLDLFCLKTWWLLAWLGVALLSSFEIIADCVCCWSFVLCFGVGGSWDSGTGRRRAVFFWLLMAGIATGIILKWRKWPYLAVAHIWVCRSFGLKLSLAFRTT